MSAIAALSIYTPDVPSAVKFYTKHLGFEVEAEYGPEMVKLRNEGVALMLCHGPASKAPAYPTGAIPGVPVKDVAAALKRLTGEVELIHREPQPFPAGRFAAVRDPAGNVLELLEFSAGK